MVLKITNFMSYKCIKEIENLVSYKSTHSIVAEIKHWTAVFAFIADSTGDVKSKEHLPTFVHFVNEYDVQERGMGLYKQGETIDQAIADTIDDVIPYTGLRCQYVSDEVRPMMYFFISRVPKRRFLVSRRVV
jgi:hypothetical protein